MRALAYIIIVAIIAQACRKEAEIPNSADFSTGENLGQLKNKNIKEASGLVESISNPGLFWVHNDSGNPAEIFLLDKETNVKLTCTLKDIDNRDWEDIAIGPGPDSGKNYLYIGDIGDNTASHKFKRIYRLEEPVFSLSGTDHLTVRAETIVFTLDKRKDAEALMIDPISKDLFVVSKWDERAVIYRLPFPQKDTMVAERICQIPATQVVSAAFSPDGKSILIKSYKNVYYWQLGEKESLRDVLERSPKILPYEEEPQGEAIAFARDGSGYYTISEKSDGEKIFLKFYKKK